MQRYIHCYNYKNDDFKVINYIYCAKCYSEKGRE